MDKYEFTSCGDCINYNQSEFSFECITCRHYYSCMFEKKQEWYEDKSNFPAVMTIEDGNFVTARTKTRAIAYINAGYRLAKSSDFDDMYFDRISK